jgi:hypothetical protein
MINHDEARELLELAAVQPGGLDRLAAGDTTESAVLADHLAGCPDCSAEAERLRASAGLIREAILETPPPELRERTLALVRAVGRPRGTLAPSAIGPSAPAPAEPLERTAPLQLPVPARRSFRTVALPLGLAAAIVLTVAGTAAFVTNRSNSSLQASDAVAAELARVANWTLRVEAEPDVRRVILTAASGPAPSGTLLFSPTTSDLVVVATGLTAAPAGQEYRCWVLINGVRTDVGRMDLGAGLAYWVGPVPGLTGLTGLAAGAPFGVSLATIDGPLTPGDPVLSGSVGS